MTSGSFSLSFSSEEENLNAVNCFRKVLVFCVWAVLSGRGNKVKEALLMLQGKKDKLSVMVSGFCERLF